MILTKLSHKKLLSLKSDIDRELLSRKELRRKETIAQLRSVAKDAGFNLEELVGVSKVRTRVPAKVKYRDPENPLNKWAGRGRKPKWLEAAQKRGKKLKDFEV